MSFKFRVAALIGLALVVSRLTAATPSVIDGISFAGDPHTIFAPIQEVAGELGWQAQVDPKSGQITLNNHLLDAAHLRRLPGGTPLAPLDELQRAGATIVWSDDGMEVLLAADHKKVAIRFSDKHVEVELSKQSLRAYQGARLVLASPISSGREGKKTPAGEFRAGPLKSPMHRSRLYHNAPMPWSVQVHENIFIHGFRKVPLHPASHGCIRLPLTAANPAKWFYDWIDVGTPISIRGHWPTTRAVGSRPSRFATATSSVTPKIVITFIALLACITIILIVRRCRS